MWGARTFAVLLAASSACASSERSPPAVDASLADAADTGLDATIGDAAADAGLDAGLDGGLADARVEPVTPRILHFAVHPRALLALPQTATVTWSVEGRAVTLSTSAGPVEGFPGTTSGSMALSLAGPGAVVLAVAGDGPTVDATRAVAAPLIEHEPNHNLENSNDISASGAVHGGIATSDDVDVFTYAAPAGGRLRISTFGPDGVGCGLDTALRVRTWAGDLLGRASDGGAEAPGGGACASVEVADGEGPGPRAPIAIDVTGEGGQTGSYLLLVEDL